MLDPGFWDGSLCGGRLEAFTTDNLPRDPRKRRDRAHRLCEGCPIWERCAGYALADNWSGLVAAGVALPETSSGNRSETTEARYQLKRKLASGDYNESLRRVYRKVRPSQRKASGEPKRLHPPTHRAGPEEWGCRCCGVALRPRRIKLCEAPNTVAEHSRSLCSRCYRRAYATGELCHYPTRCA